MFKGVIRLLLAGVLLSQVSYALPRADDVVALPVRPLARQGKPLRVVQRMYSADYCVGCHNLQAEIVRRMPKGSRVKLTFVQSLPGFVTTVPTVVYSDGTTDTGALVLNRKAGIPAELNVFELETK